MAFSSTTAFAQTVVVIDNNLSTGLKRYNPLPTNAWTPHGDAFMFTRGQGPIFGDTLFTTANDNWGVRGEYNPNGRNVSLFNFGNPSSAWTMVPSAQTVQAANGFASMGTNAQRGSDGRAWKFTGFARIGMAHYVGVHRNHYGDGVPANDPDSCRSWGGDTVILKSTDNLATFNQTLNVDPAPQSSYIFKTSPDGKAKFSNLISFNSTTTRPIRRTTAWRPTAMSTS